MKVNPTFIISDTVLRKACRLNSFSLSGVENKMILFGIRGALPYNEDVSTTDYVEHTRFKYHQPLQRKEINYYTPSCIIGQWLPAEKKVAVFPGSTVPNLNIAHENGADMYQFNCMVPGYYQYKKGQHPKNGKGYRPHKALRIDGDISFRRANYTLQKERPVINYGPSAPIYVGIAGDNIHCAGNNPETTPIASIRENNFTASFCMVDNFNSYGCQVIVGCPLEYIPNEQSNGGWNAWNTFIENIYVSKTKDQNTFKYLLFGSEEIYGTFYSNASEPSLHSVRHGSSGHLVERLQVGLQRVRSIETGIPYYSGSIDGKYQSITAQALIDYQKDIYGGKAYGFANEHTFKNLKVSFKAISTA